MKINGFDCGDCIGFAFDGCHKLYLYKTQEAKKELDELGYELYSLSWYIIKKYLDSCSLRFIELYNNENDIVPIVEQFCECVVFEDVYDEDEDDQPDLEEYTFKYKGERETARWQGTSYIVETQEV